jgi:CubicO group peptidase (beta-lactamase class C family)
VDEALALLKEQLPVNLPFRRFHYSNLAIALLGRALEKAANRGTYEALLEAEILAPLGNTKSTFDTAAAIASDSIAVGVGVDGHPLNLSASCIPSSGMPGGFSAPCGCLWATADEVGRLLQLFFRDDAPAGATPDQVLDGDTLWENLNPATVLRDGSSAVGAGAWEFKYSSGVWIRSKQGELPGYRSSVSLVRRDDGVLVPSLGETEFLTRRRALSSLRRCRSSSSASYHVTPPS